MADSKLLGAGGGLSEKLLASSLVKCPDLSSQDWTVLKGRIISWNTRGFWCVKDKLRERKQYWLKQLLHCAEIVLVQESHVTVGTFEAFKFWAASEGVYWRGSPAARRSDGVLALSFHPLDNWTSSS